MFHKGALSTTDDGETVLFDPDGGASPAILESITSDSAVGACVLARAAEYFRDSYLGIKWQY
jgi:hypothetical protein